MFDTKSSLYPDRYQIIHNLKQNKVYGKLQSIGSDGISASVTTTTTNFTSTKVQFTIQLNYDTTSVHANVVAIDRGSGFKINNVKL
jgi:hypothetical protein